MDNEIQFCDKCFNLLFIHLDEEDKLIYSCKICKNVLPYNKVDNCIYTSTFEGFDTSSFINKNKYITHDKTLPSIQSNINIKCPNEDCKTNEEEGENSFKYIKYDNDSIKYMYICETCGQKWKN